MRLGPLVFGLAPYMPGVYKDRRVIDESGIRAGRLAPPFSHLTEQDLKIRKAYMLSGKPKGGNRDA